MTELKTFSQEDIFNTHGDMFLYRDLYDGFHSKLFDRAKNLIANGEIVDRIEYGEVKAQNVQTPYIVVNICKMIVDIPTLFITRSMGNYKPITLLMRLKMKKDSKLMNSISRERMTIHSTVNSLTYNKKHLNKSKSIQTLTNIMV